jgi:hypothetical protein
MGIRIQIRILLFSSVAFKMQTKISFFLRFFLFTYFGYIYNSLNRKKVIKKSKNN